MQIDFHYLIFILFLICNIIHFNLNSVGKSCNDIGTMQEMMAAGMNIALLNLSFDTQEEHIGMIKMLRRAAKEYSVTVGKNYPLAIAARLPGRKIRTGYISDVRTVSLSLS